MAPEARFSPRPAYLLGILVASLFASAACEGCVGCGEPPPTPDSGVAVPVDTGSPAVDMAPDDGNLEEATKKAEDDAVSVAVHLGDIGRAVGAEIEAQGASRPKARPNIKSNEPETGQLAKEKLNKVFNIHSGAMKTCYERALKKSPGLQGKVRLEILIASTGSVRSAKVRGLSLSNSAIENCMERQATTMKFPEPDGGAVRVNKIYSFFPEL